MRRRKNGLITRIDKYDGIIFLNQFGYLSEGKAYSSLLPCTR